MPVVKRRLGRELLELLASMGEMAVPHIHAFLGNNNHSDRSSYYSAVSRLAKQGLIVKERRLKTPSLRISDEGSEALDIALHPERCWAQQWNGSWYMLVYDIPETDRIYRNVIRQFLKRQRMGFFQRSVWITPHDIRPIYADLRKAAGIDAFACLFEARTVLGMPAEGVIRDAWNLDRVREVQQRFCHIYKENLDILRQMISPSLDALMQLAVEEMDAYRSAFAFDPLLPRALWPGNYMGQVAYSLHVDIMQEIRRKIEDL